MINHSNILKSNTKFQPTNMKFVFIFITVTILFSCNQEKKNSKVVSSVVDEHLSDEELEKQVKAIELEEKIEKQEELENRTSIMFEKTTHDFGKVKPNTDNRYKFSFTNTGNKPLLISEVKASCGCTTPYKPEKPILPGKTDVIEVNFQPKPSQSGEISKTITVESNTDPKLTELQIKAFIEN
jgi:hypothetical protein